MVIAICDNDTNWCGLAGSILEKYLDSILPEKKLLYFESGEQLLSYDDIAIDVLFIDVELKNEDGISVANQVNKKWQECQIVFIAECLCYASEVYSVDHVFFVLKDQFEKKIEEVFCRIFQGIRKRDRKLVFSMVGGTKIALLPEEIFYFERIKRITVVETVRGQYEIRDKLDEIMERLPEIDFLRCHNSYIVCLSAVREVLKDAFVMNNGMKVMISRSYTKTAKNAFAMWMSLKSL